MTDIKTQTTTIDEAVEKIERLRHYCGVELTDWQCGYILPDIDCILEKIKELIK